MEKIANYNIYNELKRRIIEMDYKPGEAIQEKALIEEFGVSRTPVREAILKLSQVGLVEIKPRVGTYVSQIDLMAVKHAYEIKKNLESLAAELAAQRARPDEVIELFQILDRLKSYDRIEDYKACIKEDQRFHAIVRQASRNPMLIEILEELNTKTARFLQSIEHILDDFDWFYESLKETAEAIKTRDADAASHSTVEHTDRFLKQLSTIFFS